MRFVILVIIAMALIGMAGAELQLSGTTLAELKNYTTQLGSISNDVASVGPTDSMLAFLGGNDSVDGAPYGNKSPLLLGAMVPKVIDGNQYLTPDEIIARDGFPLKRVD